MSETKMQVMGPEGFQPSEYVTRASLSNESVYLGMPTYDERVHQSAVTLKRTASAVFGLIHAFHIESSSLLARTFNKLYAAALNARAEGVTHFCMIHEDVHPLEAGWLDKMLGVMDTAGADVLSAVIPLKSEEGLTSTAVELPAPPEGMGSRIKRLTMHEVFAQPETFTDDNILLNTGLMLIDLRKPWVESVWFEMIDTLVKVKGKDAEGADVVRFEAVGLSEDWNFSRKARAAGAKLWATRAIPLVHRGRGEFRNDRAWGTVVSE